MKIKKIKKPSRKSLVKNADTQCSLYIRARDKKCVICGSTENLTNGHLFSRSNYSTRWDEENCHCQCIGCNFRHESNPHIFVRWFINKYGYEKYDELFRKHSLIIKFNDIQLIQIANDFKCKLDSIISF